MQDITVARLQSTYSPPPFKCNVLCESLSCGQSKYSLRNTREKGVTEISVCLWGRLTYPFSLSQGFASPPPLVGPEIAAAGGFSACGITRSPLSYISTQERGDIAVEGQWRTLGSEASFLTASWTPPLGGVGGCMGEQNVVVGSAMAAHLPIVYPWARVPRSILTFPPPVVFTLSTRRIIVTSETGHRPTLFNPGQALA
jgi:hypothetical protein